MERRVRSMVTTLLTLLAVLVTLGCAARRGGAHFQVLPGAPAYLLRAPDSKETPFPEVPARYAPTGQGWVDLRPHMGIRVENAYFHEGAKKHTVDEFVGTEAAEYGVGANGSLRLAEVQSKGLGHGVLEQHPKDQPRVQDLLPETLARYRFHRYFYQIVFSRAEGQVSGAVLLGARSAPDLAALAARLTAEPDSVCHAGAGQCAVFPELCSVSVEMEIVVNGQPRRVLWGSVLGGVALRPKTVQVLRIYAGRLTPVEVDVSDPNALRLPLLPGDSVHWE
jgi:hypothetical protein